MRWSCARAALRFHTRPLAPNSCAMDSRVASLMLTGGVLLKRVLGGGALVRLFLGGTKVQSEEDIVGDSCGVRALGSAMGGYVGRERVVWVFHFLS